MYAKTILPIGAFVAVVIGVLFAMGAFSKPVQTTNTPNGGEQNKTAYLSAENGISFEYPASYALQERNGSAEGPAMKIIILGDKKELADAQTREGSEGPPVISILVIKAENENLEEWIRGSNFSNFKLSSTEELIPTTVGGEAALSYQHSGLYETDAVAVKRGNTVYLFSAGWLSPQDSIRSNFVQLIESVEFL